MVGDHGDCFNDCDGVIGHGFYHPKVHVYTYTHTYTNTIILIYIHTAHTCIHKMLTILQVMEVPMMHFILQQNVIYFEDTKNTTVNNI
jgi:hypothetical protein